MRQGSCLCGAVQYEILCEPKAVLNCHCRFCRKAHGAPFVPLLLMQESDLRINSGHDVIAKFHVESIGVDRSFCENCGTRLYNHVVNASRVALAVGTLDTEDGIHPIAHCNTESKCPWYEIHDTLPQFPKAPGSTDLGALLDE